jgi:dTMP kinase
LADTEPKGRLITFEGGEGVGKTTQIERLRAALERQGIAVVVTREPGGTAGAEAIRRLVIEGSGERFAPMTETLMFLAARDDHVCRLIRPALAAGKWVLSDRFIDSTRVYQGIAGSLGLPLIDRLHELVFGDLRPDRTILLDLPAREGLARRRRSSEVNRFDQMALDFHERVRAGFLSLAKREPGRIAVIDAGGSAEAVAARVLEAALAPGGS